MPAPVPAGRKVDVESPVSEKANGVGVPVVVIVQGAKHKDVASYIHLSFVKSFVKRHDHKIYPGREGSGGNPFSAEANVVVLIS